jgi:hypothetical protein
MPIAKHCAASRANTQELTGPRTAASKGRIPLQRHEAWHLRRYPDVRRSPRGFPPSSPPSTARRAPPPPKWGGPMACQSPQPPATPTIHNQLREIGFVPSKSAKPRYRRPPTAPSSTRMRAARQPGRPGKSRGNRLSPSDRFPDRLETMDAAGGLALAAKL